VILAYFGRNLVATSTCLRTLESEMSSSDWPTTKTPCHIPVVCGRKAGKALIAILVPKLVAMVTSLCPLCTRVSQMNSPMAHTLSQNWTLHKCVAYNWSNWSYGHFEIFLPILAKIWLPRQRPLDPCKQQCLLWIGWRQKPVLSVITFSLSLVDG